MSSSDKLIVCSSCGIRYLVISASLGRGATPQRAAVPRLCPGCAALEKLSARRRGQVKWFDPRRGYGFISLDHGQEIFFHRRSFRPDKPCALRRGLRVEIEIEESPEGPRASRVAPEE